MLWGLAKVGDTHVFLRRFSLLDGRRLDLPAINLPLQLGRYFNQLLLNGSLIWDSNRQEVTYVPGNPFEFWRLHPHTGNVDVKRPSLSRFRQVASPAINSMPPLGWERFDRVVNVTRLPGGRVVAHFTRGHDRSEPPDMQASHSDLEMFDSQLNPSAATIAIPPRIGLLAGSDAQGNLYFVALDRLAGAIVTKLRLVNQE
jgi:hypothetical protein